MNGHRFVLAGIRAAWVMAMLAVLTTWIVGGSTGLSAPPQPIQDGEQHMFAIFALVALTFPMGLAFAALLNTAAYLLNAGGLVGPDLGVFSTVFVWLGFAVVGYVQWFRFVPWLWSRWKQVRARRISHLDP